MSRGVCIFLRCILSGLIFTERELSAQMSEQVRGSGVSGHKYTEAEIAQVRAAIEANPVLGRQLIDSAQQGNVADLEFLIQSGLFVFSDSPTEAITLTRKEIKNTLPRK